MARIGFLLEFPLYGGVGRAFSGRSLQTSSSPIDLYHVPAFPRGTVPRPPERDRSPADACATGVTLAPS